MLTWFFLHLLFQPTHVYVHAVEHASRGLQYRAHCRTVVDAPHRGLKHYGKWQIAGIIKEICRIYDRAGTNHPA